MSYDIDLEKYWDRYKEIFSTVTLNGDILPYSLYMINIPDEYDFTSMERKRLFDKIGDVDKLKIENLYKSRRRGEVEIVHSYRSKKKVREALDKFREDEMSIFFDKYGGFRGIVIY